MASYHLTVKNGKRGKAANHALYIAREGKYRKSEKPSDLMATEYGNLPSWADDDPFAFWKMADKNERVNGAAYREFEVALPGELSVEQNLGLVRSFITKHIGPKPYQIAIHAPLAALGEVPQIHGHIMFSDRRPDDIQRTPEQHFKRYNPKHPEKGGCKKDSGGKDKVVMKTEIIGIRESFAALQNSTLEKYGHAVRVDHRSNRDRGIEREPERHLGQATIKLMAPLEKEMYLAARKNH